MSVYELQKKIDIVLNEEMRAYSAKGRSSGDLGSMNIGLQSMPNNGWTTKGAIPQLLFDKSDTGVIFSPNAAILLKLYSSLEEGTKTYFKSYLLTNLRKDSPFVSIAYFIFFVLYRIGETTMALTFARKALSGDTANGYSNLLGILSMIVSREYLHIDPKMYEGIKLALQGDTEYNFQLMEKINLALLKHLERDLSDVNPEINVDRDKILEMWGTKFTNPEVPSLVKEIEDYFREGEFTETKFATSVGRIRVLLVEVSKRLALEIARTSSDASISENSKEHNFFQYLKDKNVISNDEWNILRSLYALASDNGAHSPISKREYARLIKNMSYELILLFLSRYKL